MRRAPLVLTGTLVGLAGVLSFRSAPAAISLGALNSATTTSPTSAPSTTVAGASPPATTRTTTTSGATTPTTVHVTVTTHPPATTTPTTVAATVRTVTGPSVNYYFGTLSVKVTASGTKLTAVSIASLSDGGNPRSQSIDQQAIPMLIQQAMAAQSSKIQGVSGATYTSEGFYTSLLAALKQLGVS